MNATSVNTKNYENQWLRRGRKNKPKTNPIKPNLKKAKMNVNSVKTTDYENKRLFALRQNKPNSNPIQTQSNPISAPDFLACRLLTGLTEAINTCFRLQKDLLQEKLMPTPPSLTDNQVDNFDTQIIIDLL